MKFWKNIIKIGNRSSRSVQFEPIILVHQFPTELKEVKELLDDPNDLIIDCVTLSFVEEIDTSEQTTPIKSMPK